VPPAPDAGSLCPPERAAANLRVLPAAWSRGLASILDNDLDAVRRCNQLLNHLEQHLTGDHADQHAYP
jgi:hypothetical protein